MRAPSLIDQLSTDLKWMRIALSMAQGAAQLGEVPVGALIVRDNQIIASGINLRETAKNPILHAEMVAITSASARLGAWRLAECTLYVTLEPCLMCAGAITQSRLQRIVFGASDPKGGAYESLYQLGSDSRLNHRPSIDGGLLASQSGLLLKDFFQMRRRENLAKNAADC